MRSLRPRTKQRSGINSAPQGLPGWPDTANARLCQRLDYGEFSLSMKPGAAQKVNSDDRTTRVRTPCSRTRRLPILCPICPGKPEAVHFDSSPPVPPHAAALIRRPPFDEPTTSRFHRALNLGWEKLRLCRRRCGISRTSTARAHGPRLRLLPQRKSYWPPGSRVVIDLSWFVCRSDNRIGCASAGS